MGWHSRNVRRLYRSEHRLVVIDRERGGVFKETRNIIQVADVDILLYRVLVVVVETVVERIGVDGKTDQQDGKDLFHGILSSSASNRSRPICPISALDVRLSRVW